MLFTDSNNKLRDVIVTVVDIVQNKLQLENNLVANKRVNTFHPIFTERRIAGDTGSSYECAYCIIQFKHLQQTPLTDVFTCDCQQLWGFIVSLIQVMTWTTELVGGWLEPHLVVQHIQYTHGTTKTFKLGGSYINRNVKQIKKSIKQNW